MVGLGWAEILLLLACTAVFFLAPVAVAIVLYLTKPTRDKAAPGARQQTKAPQAPLPHGPSPGPEDRAADSAAVIARLTQRFCPQCRSPLAADSPEGLCPACLIAGGLESSPLEQAAGGLAATTPPSGSQPPAAAGEWGDLAGRFPQLEILELLGRGGMGTVYKVRQRTLDRIIALKVIPPEAAKDPAFAERFSREARAMARLNHPNIVTVYDFGHEGDFFWLMMEYVDGVNLRHTLRAGHLVPREALAIVPPICDALQYAHDQGVVHRDIKPENVLLDRSGRVKIADFGLAKLLGKGPDEFTLTRTQQVMGTPRYMAPEQIERPAAVDHRADIYSLGVVLYEMLTGELPLGRFEPPSHKVQVDVRIDQVVLRALEKAPERRYQRASQVKTELVSAASWPPTELAPAALPAAQSAPAQLTAAQAPVWHTPAPASKSSPTEYPGSPGGVPLQPVLGVAVGMVMGVLMMTGGLAAGIYGLVTHPGFSGEWWGWVGAAFGTLIGGFGCLTGSYNTYRQMAGAEDLMRSPEVTWFDWVMRGYLVLGLILLVCGVVRMAGEPASNPSFPGLLLLGGIATAQAACFLIWRTLSIQRRPKNVALPDPAREAIRRRVAGPALGLIITGALGFAPLLLAVLAVPVWTVVPQHGPVHSETGAGDFYHRYPEVQPVPEQAAPVPEQAVPVPDQAVPVPDQAVPVPDQAVPVPGPASLLLPTLGVGPGSMIALATPGMIPPPILLAQRAQPAMLAFAPVFGLLLVNLAFSITLIVGGWRMGRLKSYGLAMAAAVMAMLPCTVGWILGLPFGLWALIVLLDQDVRAGFEG